MSAVTQLVGALCALAGATWLTGSPWFLIVGGVVLLAAPEVPGLAQRTRDRRKVRAIRGKYEQETRAGRAGVAVLP